jgi:hypothetical protein
MMELDGMGWDGMEAGALPANDELHKDILVPTMSSS